MKKVHKIILAGAAFLVFGLVGLPTADAATAPNLGAAESYSIFGKAGVTNSGASTHAWGDVGSDGTNVTGLISGQVDGSIDAGTGVEAAILSAYGDLASQGATGSLNLAGTNTVAPGVYTIGATTLNGTLTLNGAGVYIFRSSSSISTSGPANVRLINGATACNVFWQIPTAMTIGAGSEIVGTIITDTAEITLADSASLQGRALARTTQVTLINNQVTEPTCTASEDEDVVIRVKKEASDYTLRSGPKSVTFTYKVTNRGDSALSDITVNDNKCEDVDYDSGDTNEDDLLDTDEEWKYSCTKKVKETETNTVTAKGTSNGEREKDTDTVKVTVSTPGLPNTGVGGSDEEMPNNFWNDVFMRASILLFGHKA